MDRRKCLKAMCGLIASGSIAAFGSYRKAGAQDSPPRNEPTMIAGPDPNTKTPSFKLPRGSTRIFSVRTTSIQLHRIDLIQPPEAPLSMFRDLHARIKLKHLYPAI
jgi:hypothetical protein